MVTLHTPRLRLREWADEDLAPFAAMNADPRVMQHLPGLLRRDESDAMAQRIRALMQAQGWGLFAAEYEGRFVGFIGLNRPLFPARFTPCVELGWRLAADVHDRGLATEGARAVLDFARVHLASEPRVAFTVPANVASWRVMQKIGLVADGSFEHPSLPEGHPLRRHCLYRDRP